MKTQSIRVLSILLLAGVLFTASAWAGQVVTNDIKAWAKNAVKQEKTLATRTAPHNSVAVLYFNNKSSKTDLDLLEKGLTLMLITDLHKVKDIQLVERVKLQALIDEMKLSKSKLMDKEYSARMGKLLGAANLVGGDIRGGEQKNFQVASNLLSVKDQKIFGKPEVEGKLLDELFKMEKALLFDIIKSLKIQLTDEERIELDKPFTTSIRALVYYIQAVEYSDAQQYAKAKEYYEKALTEDSGLDMAKLNLAELQDLSLYVTQAEAYTEPEGNAEDFPFEPKGPRKNEIIRDRADKENRLTGEIEVDFNMDLFTGLTNDMVVDFAGIKGEMLKTFDNSSEIAAIAGGKYVGGTFNAVDGQWTSSGSTLWSGPYSTGFQTVGQDVTYDANGNISSITPVYFEPGSLEYFGSSLPFGSRTSLADTSGVLSNGFLAWAIQLEEDRMNKKILEMYIKDEVKKEVIDSVTEVLEKGDIRKRDGWFMQNADAQAGRVMRDSNGDMTRVQQYVLRPAPDQVKLLNLCLRKGGINAGFSSMIWTTQLNTGYEGDLRALPWSSWLRAMPNGGYYEYGSYIDTIYADYRDCLPIMMSIEFRNPSSDILKETRYFSEPMDTKYSYRQDIMNETLELTNGKSGESQTFYSDKNEYFVVRNPIGQNEFVFQGYFINPIETPINVSFSILKDTAEADTFDTPQFTDIWDALRVNETGAANIGSNCLGITIDTDSELLSAPIDIIYIPMSRMLWKDDDITGP